MTPNSTDGQQQHARVCSLDQVMKGRRIMMKGRRIIRPSLCLPFSVQHQVLPSFLSVCLALQLEQAQSQQCLCVLLPFNPAVTFELRNTAGAVVSTFTAITDATGLARVTVPAQTSAVKYSVTATATPACGSTTGSVPSQPKPGSGTTLEWIT
jgi:hypothetical protein